MLGGFEQRYATSVSQCVAGLFLAFSCQLKALERRLHRPSLFKADTDHS
jgi:hypothetical protein